MNDSTNPRPPYEEPPTLTVNLWRLSDHEWYGCTLPTKSTRQLTVSYGQPRKAQEEAMYFKQISEILAGVKTQTRRVCKAFEEPVVWPGPDYDYAPLDYVDEVAIVTPIWGTTGSVTRSKWAVGRTYAVTAKRGKPAVWWREKHGKIEISPLPGIEWRPTYVPGEPTDYESMYSIDHRDAWKKQGYQEARIRITAIRREPLQSITEADARAEGVESVAEYRELWERINGKTKGADWESNPDVWVLSFELVKDGAP